MRNALRRFPLERAIQLAIAAVIVTGVLAAGTIVEWIPVARTLRWLALVTLFALALAYAVNRRSHAPPAVVTAAAALAGFALVSTAWSPFASLTLQRALALTLLFAACAALAVAMARDPAKIGAVLGGIVLGVGFVVAGGLVLLLVDPDRAVQSATPVLPARYQGLGGGPNTATMVMAVAAAPTAYVARAARAPLVRVVAGAVLVALVGSIAASGSRGALVAASVGLFVYAVGGTRGTRQRLVAGGAVAALLAVAIVVSRIPQPDPDAPALPSGAPAVDPVAEEWQPRRGYVDPTLVPRLQDEVGQPFGVAETTPRPRRLLDTSGRLEAWRGALSQALDRPLLGYGFGTEDRVFVERFVGFKSSVPENSYVGIFLQLGAVGLVLLLVVVGTLVRAAGRGLRDADGGRGALVAACAGVVAAGLVLGCFQSYLLAAGNNATAALWLGAFALGAAGASPALRPMRRPPRSRVAVATVVLALVAAAAVTGGRWERGRHADEQAGGIATVARAVGSLDSRTLSTFRFQHTFQCLLYRRGDHPFALELCVQPDGRVVEALDRRSGEPRFWSLREDPARAPLVDRELVDALFLRIGVPERHVQAAHRRAADP